MVDTLQAPTSEDIRFAASITLGRMMAAPDGWSVGEICQLRWGTSSYSTLVDARRFTLSQLSISGTTMRKKNLHEPELVAGGEAKH